jgi:hypothetical protein
MRNIGFSTGALAKGDFREAMRMLSPHAPACLELSALRLSEVVALVEALPTLDLNGYSYLSFHAPGRFLREEEEWLATLLLSSVPADWPIVMHPDAIFDFSHWKPFGRRLSIENMDRRKPCGRNVAELTEIFSELPEASLCFDIGHARQYDSSMTEAFLILTTFAERIVQVHVSEVNSDSQHDPISYGAKLAFQQVAELIPQGIPIIVESRVPEDRIAVEIENARESLSAVCDRNIPQVAISDPGAFFRLLQSA